MAAQTSRIERDALFVALDDLKAAGGSVALSRVSAAPATTLQNAMELLVAAGHADAVVAALDAAEQQQSRDTLMRLCQQTLDLAREKVDRETVGEQLLRAAPTDIVGEIQGFAAPAAPEPRRVRLKREYHAEVAASAARMEEVEKHKRWSEAAKPVLELLRSRRHEGNVSIEAVEAALLINADNEPLDAWLNAVEVPRPRVSAWGRESEDKKLKEQWQRDFGYGVEDEAISLLYAACSLGDVETVKLFLRHGAWIHAGSREGGYFEGNGKGHPLHGALSHPGRSPECALAILEAWTAGTGVNGYPTRHGHSARLGDGSDFSRNPLHDACGLDADADALAVVKKLVSLGARVDPPNYDGERPLHIACERGHATLVAFLLREGADPATAGEQFQFNDEKGIEFELQLNACSTPLEICEARGYDDCARLIRKALGKAAPTEPTTPEDYRQDLEIVRACLGRNFWRYYGLKGKGIGRHRRIASDDAFPETAPKDVDAAFKRLKDRVFDIRDYQARRREPELYAKWEAWEKSAARDAWEAAYRSESDDANPWGDY